MADISEIEAAQAVKIIGSEADGTESVPINSNVNGKMYTADISDNGGVQGVLTVGNVAIEAKVGGSALIGRVTLTDNNNTKVTINWGYDNTVTTATGTPMEKNQLGTWECGPNTKVYFIANTNSKETRVTESA